MDANVLVAAFATRGLCADLFQALVAQHEVIVPEPVAAEVERALARKLAFPREQISQIIAYLRDVADLVPSGEPLRIQKLDAADSAIVASAVHARAEAFVTGDQQILAEGSVQSMAILSPRAMWERLSGSAS